MAHEKMFDTVEELEGLLRSLNKRLNEMDVRREALHEEIVKVTRKIEELKSK